MRLSKPFPLPVAVIAAAIILAAPVYFHRGDTVSGVYASAIMSAQAATPASGTSFGLSEFRDIAAGVATLVDQKSICPLRSDTRIKRFAEVA